MPAKGTYNNYIITGVIVLFAVMFGWLLFGNPSAEPALRVPGLDNRPKGLGENDSVMVGEFFEEISAAATEASGNWPRFRGPNYDNISNDPTPIAESWPEEGPPIIWQVPLGEGYAAPAIYDGKVYILDYNEKQRADALRCFSLENGEELWKRWYHVAVKRNHGMSRTIPAVTEKYVLSMGPRCHVMCLARESGDLLWSMDLVRDWGAKEPGWYTAQCPLIDNGTAVIAIGGNELMVGVDCETGEIEWRTPNPDSLRMSHSSVMPATILGKKMYIYMAVGGTVGISAEGDDKGQLLWKANDWNPTVIAPSPVIAGNQLILTAGYGAGGARLTINKTAEGFSATTTDIHTPKEGLSSEQQTPLLTGNFIWTINTKDAGALRNELTCYQLSNILTPVWSSGKEGKYGLGPYMIAGDRLFLVNDDSELFMFRLNRGSVTLMAHHKVFPEGADAWGPLAYTNGYLLMRDNKNMACLYIGK